MSASFNMKDKVIEIVGDGFQTGKLSAYDFLKSIIDMNKIEEYLTFIQIRFEIIVMKVNEGDTTYIAIIVSTFIITVLFAYFMTLPSEESSAANIVKKDEPIIQRDFTIDQLREFDGKNGKPIYISLKFEVFDVSSAAGYYGEGAG